MNEDDSIFAAAKPDGFTHESPIRAFTDFKVEGTWAIGKGFRPSLGHLATYLNAMQAKEGWHLVQLLDAGTLDPTLIFQRDRILSFTVPDRLPTGSDAVDTDALMPEITPNPVMLDYLADFLNVERATLLLEFERTTGESIMRRLVRCPILHAKLPTELQAGLKSYRDRYLYAGAPGTYEHMSTDARPPSPLNPAAFSAPYGQPATDLNAPHGVPLLIRVRAQFREVESSGRFLTNKGWHIITRMDGEQVTSEPMTGEPVAWREGPKDEWRTAAEYHAVEADCDDQETEAASKRIAFDDFNPSHYGGWECGDIGERLSANGYQMLKYCWRLGKKDDPCKEVGKAIRYCDRELALLNNPGLRHSLIRPNIAGIKATHVESFMEERIADQPTFTQNIARMLWAGYNVRRLTAIREAMAEHAFHLDCGRGLAI